MNVTKLDILFALSKHAGKWIKPRTIAKELGLKTTEGINRISQILYRLRNDKHIERRNNSHDYSYRYIDEIGGYPPNIPPLSKIEGDKKTIKAIGDSDKFNGFTFIESLDATEEGYCELCESHTQIAFKGEKGDSVVFLCLKHGKAIDKQLGGYGGVFP